MDSYRQWQISQSDCEISCDCGKKNVLKVPLQIYFHLKFPSYGLLALAEILGRYMQRKCNLLSIPKHLAKRREISTLLNTLNLSAWMMPLKTLSSLTLRPSNHLARLCITTYIALDNLVVRNISFLDLNISSWRSSLQAFYILIMYINNSKDPKGRSE